MAGIAPNNGGPILEVLRTELRFFLSDEVIAESAQAASNESVCNNLTTAVEADHASWKFNNSALPLSTPSQEHERLRLP